MIEEHRDSRLTLGSAGGLAMSSISIADARSQYGGITEQETVNKMAAAEGCLLIYKYAHDYGDKMTHSTYKRLWSASEEDSFLHSPRVHNVVLVFDRRKGQGESQP